MELLENVPIASLTTFKVGGAARFVAICKDEKDIQTALTYARERSLPWYVIGGGSNVLARDIGYGGVIIQPLISGISFEIISPVRTAHSVSVAKESSEYKVTAGAGVVWDALVQESVMRGLWGLENLSGIPGLVGGAPVQNIGAYGADVSGTLSFVDTFDTKAGIVGRFSKEECEFGYRDSRFKHDPSHVILRAEFILSTQGTPHTNYPDLVAKISEGETLDTPEAVARAVRAIRAKKFPDLKISGTAGSFFKNPIITKEKYSELLSRFPELPGFPVANDASTRQETDEEIKIPLAWILDHVLHLRGFTHGLVRCFESQPLVIVTEDGATEKDVEQFAKTIEAKVLEETGISIEREVRMI